MRKVSAPLKLVVRAHRTGELMYPLLMPFGFLLLGAIFVGIGLRLLAAHRPAFAMDNLSIKSFEILARIFRFGSSGYFAVLALIVGFALLFVGVLLLLL